MINNQFTNQHIAVFGAGRLGKHIINSFLDLGYMVDIYDITKKAVLEFESLPQVQTFLITQNTAEDYNLIKTRINQLGFAYSGAFHTYIYNSDHFRNWMKLMYGSCNYFGIMGTILTYNRELVEGNIKEEDPLLNLEEIDKNGGYVKTKALMEYAVKDYMQEHPEVKIFIPKSMHILGPGWIPGISPAYFRTLELIPELIKGRVLLPFLGESRDQIVDVRDLGKIIALAMHKKFVGGLNIVNPEIITEKKYHEILHTQLKKLGIVNHNQVFKVGYKFLNSIQHAFNMLFDFVVSTKKLEALLEYNYNFIPVEESLMSSLNEALSDIKLHKGDPDVAQKMDAGEPTQLQKAITNLRTLNKSDMVIESFLWDKFKNLFFPYSTHARMFRFESLEKAGVISKLSHYDLDNAKRIAVASAFPAIFSRLAWFKEAAQIHTAILEMDSNSSGIEDYQQELENYFRVPEISKQVENEVRARTERGLEALVSLPDVGVIVELGAGYCGNLKYMHSNYPHTPKCIGLDYAESINFFQPLVKKIWPEFWSDLSLLSVDMTNSVEFVPQLVDKILEQLGRISTSNKNVAIYAQGLLKYLLPENQNKLFADVFEIAKRVKPSFGSKFSIVLADNKFAQSGDVISEINGTGSNLQIKETFLAHLQNLGWSVSQENGVIILEA